MLPQNRLVWHSNYFELKASEKQLIQKGMLTSLFLKTGNKNPKGKISSLYQEEENILNLRDGGMGYGFKAKRNLYKQTLLKEP